MGKSKRGPALFELLEDVPPRGAPMLKAPRSWNAGESAPAEDPAAGVREDEPPVGGGPTIVAPAEETADTGAWGSLRNAWLALDGDRVRFSFTSVSAAVTLFVALAVLAGTFELGVRRGQRIGRAAGWHEGRASYEAEVASEIEQARRQPPATDVVADLLREPTTSATGPQASAAAATEGVATVRWIPGHTYIVIQEFRPDRLADASNARDFLRQRGVASEVVTLESGAAQLITTQGFDRKDAAQRALADQLLQKVQAAGAAYFGSGGGYKLEGYFKTLTRNHW